MTREPSESLSRCSQSVLGTFCFFTRCSSEQSDRTQAITLAAPPQIFIRRASRESINFPFWPLFPWKRIQMKRLETSTIVQNVKSDWASYSFCNLKFRAREIRYRKKMNKQAAFLPVGCVLSSIAYVPTVLDRQRPSWWHEIVARMRARGWGDSASSRPASAPGPRWPATAPTQARPPPRCSSCSTAKFALPPAGYCTSASDSRSCWCLS